MTRPALPDDASAAKLLAEVRRLRTELDDVRLRPLQLPIYVNPDSPDEEQRAEGAPWIDYEKGAICWQINNRVYCTDSTVTVVDGATLASPFNFYFGTGNPASSLGTQGDVYENTNNGDLWKKLSGGWTLEDNLTGPTGATGATGATGPAGSGGGLWRTYDVSTYTGADPTGVGDSTAAFNAATNDATANGGRVWVPPAEWSVAAGALKAGVTYEGVRGKSVIKIRAGATHLLGCDSGSSTSFVSQMSFIGLTFRGRVDTDTTFDEQRHLFRLAGVQDVGFWNCDFIGWHGDGIYLAGVDFLGSGTSPRHNQRVKVRDCFFDGLTKNNRNCVSIIDGDSILIDGCVGRRFSRSDMPGFVDVEPNGGNGTFAVVKGVEVSNCRTYDHNQNFFQLNLPDATYATAPVDFHIHDNIDDAGATNSNTRFAYLAYARTATASSSRQNIKIHDNACRNAYAVFEIEGGICGMEAHSNTFEDCPGAAILGYWNATTRYLRFHHNTWSNCGSNDGNVVRIEYANNVTFEHETFHNCVGNLIYFGLGESSAGASSDIDYIDNEITGTGTTSISGRHASHAYTPSTNRRRPYRENGLTISATHFATLV